MNFVNKSSQINKMYLCKNLEKKKKKFPQTIQVQMAKRKTKQQQSALIAW